MRLALIIGHAAAGVGAFVVGVLALQADRERDQRRMLRAFVWLVVAMLAFVVGALATHWGELDTSARVIFGILVGLALFMVYRARRAQQALNDPGEPTNRVFVNHIGFVLIALADGFVIVAAIDLGASPILVTVLALAVIAVGHQLVGRAVADTVSSGGE